MKPDTMLMIPGPTPVPQAVLSALALPPIGHRSADFKRLLQNIQPKLQWLFQTKRPVYVYAASGTGAMEAALQNTVNPQEDILVLACGVFSHRWADIGKALGLNVHLQLAPDGEASNLDELTHFLNSPDGKKIKAVCLIHNETSTAVMNPLKSLCEAIRSNAPDALIIVDTVTSLGAVNFEFDNWDIDIAVSGSQKGFMLPPGLAFIAVSERALAQHKAVKNPGYYFNFSKYEKGTLENQTPYTPAITLYQGLDVALNLMQAETLEGIFKRHELNTQMTRAAIKAINLPLMVKDDTFASRAVTAVRPDNLDAEEFRKRLRDQFSITVAGGQKDLKGRIFRIGHLGAIYPRDILTTVSSIEVILKQLNHSFELGSGVKAAQEVLLTSQKQVAHV